MPDGRRAASPVIALTLGLIALGIADRSPGFEAIRSVHVLLLLASGMCFGVALTGFLVAWRRRTP